MLESWIQEDFYIFWFEGKRCGVETLIQITHPTENYPFSSPPWCQTISTCGSLRLLQMSTHPQNVLVWRSQMRHFLSLSLQQPSRKKHLQDSVQVLYIHCFFTEAWRTSSCRGSKEDSSAVVPSQLRILFPQLPCSCCLKRQRIYLKNF